MQLLLVVVADVVVVALVADSSCSEAVFTTSGIYNILLIITSDKEELNVFTRVRLSVCLFVCLSVSKVTQKRMDFDEMLCVDRCRDVDELINF